MSGNGTIKVMDCGGTDASSNKEKYGLALKDSAGMPELLVPERHKSHPRKSISRNIFGVNRRDGVMGPALVSPQVQNSDGPD